MSRTGNLVVVYVEDDDPVTVRWMNCVDINGHIHITTASPDATERLVAALIELASHQRAAEVGP